MKVLEYGKSDLSRVLVRSAIDYGQALKASGEIIEAVREKGDVALREYTRRFDGRAVRKLRVQADEIEGAYGRVDGSLVRALMKAHKNISRFHRRQYALFGKDWAMMVAEGVECGERFTPIESVGCYVPGGRGAYPSTVLMTVTPAKIAGVSRIVVVSPPPIPDVVLAACRIAGVDEVYRVGGAQAVGALAYGTKSIRPVSKIVGPGNKYVTAAKMRVYGRVDIDMPAGPSEILIIADDSANPEYMACDIVAQAEHDPNSPCVLVTTDRIVAEKTAGWVRELTALSGRRDVLGESLRDFSIIMVKDLGEAVAFANDYAPEHLEIHARNAKKVAKGILNAGAVFVGEYAPVAAGDYATGANHVLPTGQAAKFASQLSVRDFMKSTSVQYVTREGLGGIAGCVSAIALSEGLCEHERSVRARLR
jgi:histidinol dehydrogenase